MSSTVLRLVRHQFIQTMLHHWQRLLSYLLWLVIFLQILSWLENFWLPETRLVVMGTLWVVFVCEAAIPMKRMLRLATQILAVLVAHIVVLDLPVFNFSIAEMNGLVQISTAFGQHLHMLLQALIPYIWFSLVAWLIYWLITRVTQRKAILYLVLFCTIIFFAVLDSFTVHILWQRIAVVIICALLLAINHHYQTFADKHPASWSYLQEYPGMIIGFVVVIVAVTLLASLLAPNVRPVFMDPYTAWKRMQGERVESFGKGQRVLTPILRGDASSGYRRDDTDLGDGFRFDYSEVMTLQTSFRSYLRGDTRSIYTGSGWEATSMEKDPVLEQIVKERSLSNDVYDDSKLETYEVHQRLTMKREVPYPVLFGGYRIDRLMSIGTEENDVLFSFAFWSPHNSVLHWFNWDDYYPDSYELVSHMPIIDVEGLRTTSPQDIDAVAMAEYLQLPDELPARVTQLALEITEEAMNQYDQVKMIEWYLKTSFPYTNEPDLSKGSSEDFVDRFLFEIQEGYCDYYSTAMVVLARTLGIPARWVKGYSSGVLPTDDFLIFRPDEYRDPNEGGEYTIRNADAHSWAEVYFDGWGWIPFEATAGFSMPERLHEEEAVIVPEFITPIDTEQEAAKESAPALLSVKKGAVISLICIVVILAIIIFRRQLWAWWVMLKGKRDHLSNDDKIVREFNRLTAYARKKGFDYDEYKTAREIVQSWTAHNRWLTNDLTQILNLFEMAKYSDMSVNHDDYYTAVNLMKKVRTEMK